MNAWLVFIDESGLLMMPFVRRSWAPTGETPILLHRGCSHKKVSAIAALCLSPNGRKVSLYFRLHPDANITTRCVRAFLEQIKRQLPGPIVVIWDCFQPHRAVAMRKFLERKNGKITAFYFPPYTPEMNPVEGVWGYLKTNPLANRAPWELETLTRFARSSSRSLQKKEQLLHSFINHSQLPLRIQQDRTLFM